MIRDGAGVYVHGGKGNGARRGSDSANRILGSLAGRARSALTRPAAGIR